MAVERISPEALDEVLAALQEIVEVAASEASGGEEGGVVLTPVAVEAVSREELASELQGPLRAVVVPWGEKELYYLQPGPAEVDLGTEQVLTLLTDNLRHFLEGLAEDPSDLGPARVEDWDQVQPERLPPDPLLRVTYELGGEGKSGKLYLTLSTATVGGLLTSNQSTEPESAAQKESEPMPREQDGRKVEVSTPNFEEFASDGPERTPRNLEMLYDLALTVSVELGRTQMTIGEVLELGKGSIVELDKMAGDPVDLYINGRKFAEGDVVVVEDRFGVRVTALVGRADRIKTLGEAE